MFQGCAQRLDPSQRETIRARDLPRQHGPPAECRVAAHRAGEAGAEGGVTPRPTRDGASPDLERYRRQPRAHPSAMTRDRRRLRLQAPPAPACAMRQRWPRASRPATRRLTAVTPRCRCVRPSPPRLHCPHLTQARHGRSIRMGFRALCPAVPVENFFSGLEDFARIALRRDKTRPVRWASPISPPRPTISSARGSVDANSSNTDGADPRLLGGSTVH
jgi:hypothetical protein